MTPLRRPDTRYALAALALALGVSEATAQQRAPRPAASNVSVSATPQSTALGEAEAAYAAGDAARAAGAYERVLAIDPNNSRALYRLGQLRTDRPAESVRLFRRYTVVQPRDAWGHIALGDALARAGDLRGALSAYAVAERLEPRDRDVHVGRARVLARAGRTDDAVVRYESWLRLHPRDAEAWSELARLRRRAGRTGEALIAAERAHQLEPSGARATTVAGLRSEASAAIELRATGTRDSDAIGSGRLSLGVALPHAGRGRVTVVAGNKVVDGLGARAKVRDMTLETRWRPLATTRIDAAASLAQRSASLDSAGASPMATGRLRTSWRAPSGRVAVDLRAARLLLDANPLLVRAGAVRDEIATELDVAIVGPMRARGSARVGAVRSGGQSNGRTVVGGALVASGAGGELGARVQQLRYAAPSTGGYFAPRQADLAELSMYSEREAENGATLALDLGAGLQRIAQFEETTRGWSPALRGWAQLAMPLTRRTALGVELEAYDSRAGGDAMSATAGAWRYGSASMFIRARTR